MFLQLSAIYYPTIASLKYLRIYDHWRRIMQINAIKTVLMVSFLFCCCNHCCLRMHKQSHLTTILLQLLCKYIICTLIPKFYCNDLSCMIEISCAIGGLHPLWLDSLLRSEENFQLAHITCSSMVNHWQTTL